MLVLSRTVGEKICIGDGIVLTVVEFRGNKVRLGIEADRQVPVHRKEVWDLIHPPVLPTVVCAWCQREGVPALMSAGGPMISHGICDRHRREQLEEVRLMQEQREDFEARKAEK